jgi:hypothetical protein
MPLIVHGQGIFMFEHTEPHSCVFHIWDSTQSSGLRVTFTDSAVNVHMLPSDEPLVDTHNVSGLVHKPGAYYWFSLDSQNQVLRAGIGEARMETVVYTHRFMFDSDDRRKANKAFLESLATVEVPAEGIEPLKFIRDPVSSNIPLRIARTDDLTMDDVARGDVLPHSNLSPVAQKLYDCVSGTKFGLDTRDFPDFSAAIEHSIVTPGLWCNTRLKEKATEFNKDNPNYLETYLRITLNENNGESPGIPYVMEIWPRGGHYSPVHNHAGANAVIRVLHGQIHVKLFPYLCEDAAGVEPFATADFAAGDVTWLSPNLNQVHQLVNVRNDASCITIQCYMYDGDDARHYDYFDYIDATGKKMQYEPDSDMDFLQFKELIRREWAMRPRRFCAAWR